VQQCLDKPKPIGRREREEEWSDNGWEEEKEKRSGVIMDGTSADMQVSSSLILYCLYLLNDYRVTVTKRFCGDEDIVNGIN